METHWRPSHEFQMKVQQKDLTERFILMTTNCGLIKLLEYKILDSQDGVQSFSHEFDKVPLSATVTHLQLYVSFLNCIQSYCLVEVRHWNGLVRVRGNIMFCLKIPGLVTTNTAGDGMLSRWAIKRYQFVFDDAGVQGRATMKVSVTSSSDITSTSTIDEVTSLQGSTSIEAENWSKITL